LIIVGGSVIVAELLSSTLLILTLLLRYIINLPKYFKFKLF